MNDPWVALLELVCVLTPDRSEWRSHSRETVLVLLCQAAAVEKKCELERVVTPQSSIDMSVDHCTPALPIQEEDLAGDGVLVAAENFQQKSNDPSVSERFLSFLERILESERVSYRTLATEIAVSALERSGSLGQSSEGCSALVKKLLVALVKRCTDAVPTVRSRALGGVATALHFLSKSGEGTKLLRELVTHNNTAEDQSASEEYVDVATLFRAAALDEKPSVRKSALSFFDTLLPVLRASLGLEVQVL